ncbi:MAG: helix-turn-helix domain-containing protein [bacterium]
MINEDKRKAVRTLYAEGRRKKEITRLLGIDRKTVRGILSTPEDKPIKPRRDKKDIDPDLLRKLYTRCNGYLERLHEVLTEEFGLNVGYSTLTRMIRQSGIGREPDRRFYQVADEPGIEMQHDTTPYTLKIGGKPARVICSGLYLRYCKMRYIKFYPNFNRFRMKCFFYEALTHWKRAAKRCVIDNTNLAVLHGTGQGALFHPEMIAFARPYGFEWLAHEKGHANRKAGKERNFWTIETNFFPGRTFESIEDLNRQAFEWATIRYALRPHAKTRLIPGELFEGEKPYLIELPGYIEPPYLEHQRNTDQYGYIAFNGNYYWVPGKARPEVKVIEYPGWIKIFLKGQQPITYSIAAWNVKNQKFLPDGINPNPYEPKSIKRPCHEEERRLRNLGKVLEDYLDFIKSRQSDVKQKPRFIRTLYALSKKMTPSLFTAAIERALKYKVESIEALARIAGQLIKKDLYIFPEEVVDNNYKEREAYQKGCFSQEREIMLYQDLPEEKEDKE